MKMNLDAVKVLEFKLTEYVRENGAISEHESENMNCRMACMGSCAGTCKSMCTNACGGHR